MNRGTADESLQIERTLLETVAGGLLKRAKYWTVIDSSMAHLTLVSGYIHLNCSGFVSSASNAVVVVVFRDGSHPSHPFVHSEIALSILNKCKIRPTSTKQSFSAPNRPDQTRPS